MPTVIQVTKAALELECATAMNAIRTKYGKRQALEASIAVRFAVTDVEERYVINRNLPGLSGIEVFHLTFPTDLDVTFFAVTTGIEFEAIRK